MGASFLTLLLGAAFVLRSGESAHRGVVAVGNSSVDAVPSQAGAGVTGPVVGTGLYQGVSPAVRDLPALPAPPSTTPAPRELEHAGYPGVRTEADDPVVQTAVGDAPMPAPLQNFDGICLGGFGTCTVGSTCSCLPRTPSAKSASATTSRW